MAVCVETVNKYPLSDHISPVFIFERLCNIIYPKNNDAKDFQLSLEKDAQQEDFLQGRMLGNPYNSTEPGLGPLMRDVKNKICQGGCSSYVTGCLLLVATCLLLVAGCLLLVAGCLLLVAGCLLLVACCWLLVACCWLLVAGCFFAVCTKP